MPTGSIAGDTHAAAQIGYVERDVDSVDLQNSKGEHIICIIEGCSVLNADTRLDGVDGTSQLASTIRLQIQKMGCHVLLQHKTFPYAVSHEGSFRQRADLPIMRDRYHCTSGAKRLPIAHQVLQAV